jgi:2-methylcitrate dehydratase PrpD
MATPAEELGAFIAATRFESVPVAIVEKTKRHTLDTLGAALAGATSTEAQSLRRLLGTTEPAGNSIAWGTSSRFAPRSATLHNATAAHAFELDDTGGCDHSGAVAVPAAFAAIDLAEGPVSGPDLLTAIVLGYDLGRRTLEAFGGYKPHNQAGWHSTGTCGTFAAAAAAAAILRLDARQAASALGLAGSFSSGLWAFIHDGAMVKRVHPGRAAEGGLLAAMLARSGITGSVRIFDDVWGGFLKTFGHGPLDPAALTRGLGRDWKMADAAIKPYACCRDTHSAVDAIGRLAARAGFGAGDIASIRVRANAFLAGMIGGRDVSTMPAAQMSLPYAVAVRVVLGQASLSAYDAATRSSPAVAALLARIEVVVDPSVVASDQSSVTVTLNDGRTLEEPTAVPLGAPANPLDDAGLVRKYRELAGLVLPESAVAGLAEEVLALDQAKDAKRLSPMLAGRA